MNRDPIDDSGKPFEPETPEAFFQCGEDAFQSWWRELDPPGLSGGLRLDYETSRNVWAAAYEHFTNCIMLVYDGAEANATGAHSTGEMQLACAVDQHHGGSISFSCRDFNDWAATHEERIRYAYTGSESDVDADTVTIWIDRSGQSPESSFPIKRPPAASTEDLRTSADEYFAAWWQQLDPPGTLSFMHLDRNEALVVWREAYTRMWEDLEVIHDSAKAYAEVIAETANLELVYIVDRFHDGTLSLAVNDVLAYWDEREFILERNRTDDVITLRVLGVNQGQGN